MKLNKSRSENRFAFQSHFKVTFGQIQGFHYRDVFRDKFKTMQKQTAAIASNRGNTIWQDLTASSAEWHHKLCLNQEDLDTSRISSGGSNQSLSESALNTTTSSDSGVPNLAVDWYWVLGCRDQAAKQPLHLKCSALAPVSLKPLLLSAKSAVIGQLTHAWASTPNNNRAAVLNQLLCAKLATNDANVWHDDLVWCH